LFVWFQELLGEFFMVNFISLAGHIAVAYWHFLLVSQLYRQDINALDNTNYFMHLFKYLVLLFLGLHLSYAVYYLALVFGQDEVLKYATISAYLLLAFLPAILATLFLGELTKMPDNLNPIARALSYISKNTKKLFVVCMGISTITVINPVFTELTTGHENYTLGNIYALVLLFVFGFFWLLMYLSGLRTTTKQTQSERPVLGYVIAVAVLLLLSSVSVLINVGESWSLIPIISTTALSLSFCWYRFRAQFMDVILNQFLRILILIVIVIVLKELVLWMSLRKLSSDVQMLFLFLFILAFGLLFNWLNNKMKSLWHPSIEKLSLVHSELPILLTQCTDYKSSIEKTELYLSKLFSTHTAINKSLPNSVQTLKLEGDPQIEINLNYLRLWMPWFSEALYWVRTAGLYLQSHLKILQTLEHEHQQKLKTENLISLAAKAELNAMRAQIRPHFLFNILNSIHCFISTDPKMAERTIEILSEIMRNVLIFSNKDKVALHQELDITEKYLLIEKIRYGEQFEYQISIEPQCNELLIPPFSVQPLIENAIKHAVDSQFDPVLIVIKVRIDNGTLVIEVLDDGPGLTKQSLSTGLGMALKNIKGRLKLLYGEESELTLKKRIGKGAVASINIPIL
jgi:signal transduction histidine kinase